MKQLEDTTRPLLSPVCVYIKLIGLPQAVEITYRNSQFKYYSLLNALVSRSVIYVLYLVYEMHINTIYIKK